MHLLIANHRAYLGNEYLSPCTSDVTPMHILLFLGMAKQLSLLSYVKTPNLARNRNNETVASESTVVILDSDEENVNESSNEGDEECEEEAGKSDEEDIESDEEGKEEDISTENIIIIS